MIIDWLDVIQQARLIQFRSRMDAATTPGQLLIYTAPKPTPGNAITTQTLLGIVIFQQPIGIITDNTFTFSSSGDVLVTVSGQPSWGRFTDGDGFWIGDAAIGLSGSGALIQTDQLDWFQGSTLRLSLSTLSES